MNLRANLPQNSDGGKPRHGTVLPVTRAEYQRVLEAYAPAIAVESVEAIEATTTAGTAPVLPDATLTTASGPTKTVPVAWSGVSPDDYAAPGTFMVRGVAQDDSRMPVVATVTVTAGVSVSATTRCVAGRVAVVGTVTNASDAAATMTVDSEYGSRTLTVAAGKSASAAFSSRQASVPAGTVTAEDATASYDAHTCG